MHFIAAALFASAYSGFAPVATIAGLVGVALIIASACVVNCITDRHIDAKMDRTKNRPLPSGEVSVRGAIIYAAVLCAAGVLTIILFSNLVVLICALVCHVTYTMLYGYVKRHSWVSTMVGTIPGALPVLAGYAAVDPSLPPVAWLLTLVILLWQLPHFYGLALYRGTDYAKSGLPLISVVKSRETVTRHILVTAVLYVAAAAVLFRYMPGLLVAGGVMLAAAVAWVSYVIVAKGRGSDAWARKVFGTSLYMPIAFLVASIVAVVMSGLFSIQ